MNFFILIRKIISYLKRLQLFPFGFRAHSSSSIALTVSADGGGKGGRIYIDENSSIDSGVILRAYQGFINIGKNCSINPYCVVYGNGGVHIGNSVRIASHCAIVAANHNYSDLKTEIYLQGESAKGIRIEDDVWIGTGVKVLDGVTIKRGSVIAAGAVVTSNTEEFSVVAGIPARKIKSRISDVVKFK